MIVVAVVVAGVDSVALLQSGLAGLMVCSYNIVSAVILYISYTSRRIDDLLDWHKEAWAPLYQSIKQPEREIRLLMCINFVSMWFRSKWCGYFVLVRANIWRTQ